MSNRAQGWLTVAAMIIALGVVGYMEEAEASEVVCTPVSDPKPTEEGEKIPVVYRF